MNVKNLLLISLAVTGITACSGGAGKSRKTVQDIPDYAKATIEMDGEFEHFNYNCFFTKTDDNENAFTAEGGLFYISNNIYHGKRGNNELCRFDRGYAYSSYLVNFPDSGDDDSGGDYMFRVIYSRDTSPNDGEVYKYLYHFLVTDPKPEQELCFLKDNPVKKYSNNWLRVKTKEMQKAVKWLAQLQKAEPLQSKYAEQAQDTLRAVRSEIGASVVWEGAIDGHETVFRSLYLNCGVVVNVPYGQLNVYYDHLFKDGLIFDGLIDADNFTSKDGYAIER
ncbi:MAG: hypothetical protein LBH32_09325 [Dysgonamonadaceae bacterium]|jgi:hypothetical protein|nr:hypothetical protein [Dysgonamonadaceae bacterium]